MENIFLALVRAGLWGDVNENENQNENLLGRLDWGKVQKLAEEQSVVGLVAAGVEKLTAYPLPLTEKLMLLGKCQLIEQQNVAMNQFVAQLVAQMREVGIIVVLLKGQGIAQCYERPLWRASGDVDFLLDEVNYEKAKSFLLPKATTVEKEFEYNKHQALTIGPYTVELHGNLRCGLSKRIDKVLDEIRKDVLYGGEFRTWLNGNTKVLLPTEECDVVYVFTHILNHFYKGGIGMRQICDWCRLISAYRDKIDALHLEQRLRKMELMTEWKAFAAFAVDILGISAEAMPLYDAAKRWSKKAKSIKQFIFDSGNLGHNRDSSYFNKYPYLVRKMCSMGRRMRDLARHARLFPMDSFRFFPSIMGHGLHSAVKGE